MAKKKVRILSIDGGGIRGIIPATILQFIENNLRKKYNPEARIADYFDFVAGTSTGGILTLAYLVPDQEHPGKAKMTADDALDIYVKRGGEIFNAGFSRKFMSLGGFIDERYDATPLEKALNEYFGDNMLSQTLRPCMITAYDLKNRCAKFFTSADAVNNPLRDYKIKDVARATSAAPTYFEPTRIMSSLGAPTELIDGGMFANNPAMCAYAEARKMRFASISQDASKPELPSAKDMYIVSIGTGTVVEEYPYEKMKDKGMAGWVKPLIDILMSSNCETVTYHLKQMYKTLPQKDQGDYIRLEPSLYYASPDMADAGPKNINRLREAGLVFVEKNYQLLDRITDKLVEHH